MSVSGEYVVLAVDDDETTLQVIRMHLAEVPCLVLTTASATEAVHLLRTREVAVLLCDLIMPEVNGNVVLQLARQHNPDIVSVLVTGSGNLDATVSAINDGGIWKFIRKPWQKAEMVTVVTEGIARYQSLKRARGAEAQVEKQAKRITLPFKRSETGGHFRTPTPLRVQRRHFRKKSLQHRGGVHARSDLSGGRYTFGEVLGEGGNGTVYRAEDTLLGLPVAIKVLSRDRLRSKRAIATLKDEARIAMQLSHAHIVRLHDLQKVGEDYLLVMEFVKGWNFRGILTQFGRLTMEFVLQVLHVCSDALTYAHRQGVVHEDLKPENLMLTDDGIVKIIDFGTACLVDTQRGTGPVVGTPEYMSPEQRRGEPLDARTDVFSMGVIVYELLTGDVPYPDEEDPWENPDLADLPEGVPWVLSKAIAPVRGDRWESVADFYEALRAAAVKPGPPAAEANGSGPNPAGATP